MNAETKVFTVAIVIFAAVAGSFLTLHESAPGNGTVRFKEMPRFASYAALLDSFNASLETGRFLEYGGIMKSVSVTPAPTNVVAGGAGQAADYSTTNVQVAGVDEADIVKSDGKYIYAVAGGKLVIVDAYPAGTARVVSRTEIENVTPSEIFVSGDRLLLFGDRNEYAYKASRTAEWSMPYWGRSYASALLFDISDRSSPSQMKTLDFEGSYVTSRLIGSHAYFVVNSWPSYSILYENLAGNMTSGSIIPKMMEDGTERSVADATDIAYLPGMPMESFVTLVSVDVDTGEMTKETVAGSADNVYASASAIYLASTEWRPWPLAEADATEAQADHESTVIMKFGLDSGNIGFVGNGKVPGTVLNQFSMDEYNGNFRIATTVGHVTQSGGGTENNLYVLDSGMSIIGKLEDLAPGERIYSARFMGQKAYMVTFKKVDPLFVIDVSDPTAPRVLGKLKIPGYSDYLHPIDETHIIGVGKETIEAAYGDFAWYQGMKLAVFDVSDVSAPKELHKVVIGDRGTDSYALSDHRAFLYDSAKELLVLPVTLAEIPADKKKPLEQESQSPAYGEPVFQGAFVYRLTLAGGFEERGRITHVTAEDELKRGYFYGDADSIKRSMYIGNVLYTYSDQTIKANDLGTLQELKSVSLQE